MLISNETGLVFRLISNTSRESQHTEMTELVNYFPTWSMSFSIGVVQSKRSKCQFTPKSFLRRARLGLKGFWLCPDCVQKVLTGMPPLVTPFGGRLDGFACLGCSVWG